MKKVIIILGALAILTVAGLAGLAFWILDQEEKNKNKARTAEATKARWAPKDPDLAQPKEKEHEQENSIIEG